ncbi:protein kinase domain-containing protein [Stackebrandtia soli]|uniref:protein kinase domain-containing protein n=1 Tax=Stackebrandtia soli TaxID=1892856 RepID=UPI0039E88B3D
MSPTVSARAAATPPGHVEGSGSRPGDVVGGYRVDAVLKVRGCAAVYRATGGVEFAGEGTSAAGGVVAVKTLCLAAPQSARRRADNESSVLRSLAGLSCVPSVVSSGVDGAQRFLAIEWRPGRSLRSVSRACADGGWDAVDAAFRSVALPVVRSVGRLHERGVAHGDLSRVNLVVTDAGDVSILDFESSVRLGEPATGRLRRKTTWAYAPPEFARERDGIAPSIEADQYALAAILYRQLTRRRHRPRPTEGVVADDLAVLDVPSRPIPARILRRYPLLDAVFARALARRSVDRFPSMDAFADALAHALGGE